MRDPDEHDDEDGQQEERRRVVRQAGMEAHDPVIRLPAARDDGEPEHEQCVGEQGPQHRCRRDDNFTRRKREEHDEELGQVAERRLKDAGGGGAEARADRLGRYTDHVRKPRERDPCGREAQDSVRVREVEHACDCRRDERSAENRRAH
jgi:hypothetical protein